MKTTSLLLLLQFSTLCFAIYSGSTALGQETGFQYQGRLRDAGAAAAGNYDFTFAVYDSLEGGVQQGKTLNVDNISVANGEFRVLLDFGAGVFTGPPRWVQIGVRKNGAGEHTILSPRQSLLPTPYSLFAASTATVSPGAVGPNQLSVTGAAPAAGQVLTFDGTSLAWTTLSAPNSGNGLNWTLRGNAGTVAGTDFVGTLDAQPLDLRVNNQIAFRLSPASDPAAGFSPNLIGGFSGNRIAADVSASVISGGGDLARFNQIHSSWGVVAGGNANSILRNSTNSTISGGRTNIVGEGAPHSTISGGHDNFIRETAFTSTIGGGGANSIWPSSDMSTISGGVANSIRQSAWRSTIGGGTENSILSNSVWSTVGGGGNNAIQPLSARSTISGGTENIIGPGADMSTISGGGANSIREGAWRSAIGGGTENIIQAGSVWSSIGGGGNNNINVSSPRSTISGGTENVIAANAHAATIPGGANNTAGGAYSLAAGHKAVALRSGAFVWASGTENSVENKGPNTFNIFSPGGVHITSPKGIATEPFDGPIITRGWDPFDGNAGARVGHGRWGLFMEFGRLVCGIPELGGRSFEIAKYHVSGGRTELLRVDQDGRTTVKTITITGGADLAEPFKMSEREIPVGSVVVIDETNPGRLKMSSEAYDRKVAGIISGANGVKPGITLQQEGLLDGDQNVALTGRVYALADARESAIRPGDLLTTSNVPGHAMKVTEHSRAQGAILGKAMTALESGCGMVLVLVTLQ